MSHGAYLADLDHDRVMVIWFSGSREWAKDVHLLCAIFSPNAGQWSPITEFVSEVGFSVGNSVVAREPMGRIHIWYVRTKGYWQEGEIVHMIKEDVEGGFSSKEILPLAKGWLVRGRPILRGNTVYLPIYNETTAVSTIWEQNLLRAQGSLSEMISAPGGLIHPTLVDFDNNEFRCFLRNPRAPNRIHYAYSMDRGATWSKAYPTALPNPNSGIDVVRLNGSRLICAYNDSEKYRHPLSLAMSDNGGMDWHKVGDLEREVGEFSYPSMLRTPDAFYMAYTYKREAIKFIALDTDSL